MKVFAWIGLILLFIVMVTMASPTCQCAECVALSYEQVEQADMGEVLTAEVLTDYKIAIDEKIVENFSENILQVREAVYIMNDNKYRCSRTETNRKFKENDAFIRLKYRPIIRFNLLC